jgi:SH3-like domain-containing protein
LNAIARSPWNRAARRASNNHVRFCTEIPRALGALRAAAIALGVTCSTPVTALAQTVYVTDDLRIAMRSGPGDEFRVLRILVAGTELEEVERSEPWVRVSLAGGPEGWVQSRYLSEELPARVQVPKLLDAQERSRQVIAKLEAELKELESIEQEAQRLRGTTTALSAENARLTYAERARDMLSGAGIALAGLLVGALWPRRSAANSLATGKRIKL